MLTLASFVKLITSHRRSEIEYFMKNSIEVQERELKRLLKHLEHTKFGKERGVKSTDSTDTFQHKISVSTYEELSPYILDTKRGASGILWDSDVKWFAKSSGTTDAKSKYIPITKEGLVNNHFKGPKDVIVLFAAQHPESKAFGGKTLTLGGSRRIEHEGEALSGDLSAILIDNTPSIASLKRTPSRRVALIADFDEKVEAICKQCVKEDVRSFAGVPSWNLVLMNKILEYTGKSNILEVWENMELFIHGGVSFSPYKSQFNALIPSPNMKYMETYNASEGFFAIADNVGSEEMLLMLDYGQFYEFLPLDSLNNPSKAIPLEGVKIGVNYALIMSSVNGLWRYMIGDTVVFTSTNPYRIKISGRTKHYINCFGEEVMVDNVERAISEACLETKAMVKEFSVAPIYMEGREKGAHQWVVEFEKEPQSREQFMDVIDKTLRSVNSDYDAKRFKNTTLNKPILSVVKDGAFLRWLEIKGKVGGQNKVPRLSNNREFIEEIINLD